MPVRMELSRILIRELNDYQIIELREVAATPSEDGSETFSHASAGYDPMAVGSDFCQSVVPCQARRMGSNCGLPFQLTVRRRWVS